MRKKSIVTRIIHAGAWLMVIAFVVADADAGMADRELPPPEALNFNPKHTGIDLSYEPGEVFVAPFAMQVAAIVTDTAANSHWRGIVLRLAKSEKSETLLRILGIESDLKAGDWLNLGDPIGLVQDAGKDLSGITPYLHVEVYIEGLHINPTEWVGRHLPAHPLTNPGVHLDWNNDIPWKQVELAEQAYTLRKAGKYREAVAAYREALNWPKWETSNTSLYELIAVTLAEAGDFAGAIKTQEKYLELLSLEYRFAEGHPPDPRLGTIAAVRNTDTLGVLIGQSEDNLAEFRAGRPAIYK